MKNAFKVIAFSLLILFFVGCEKDSLAPSNETLSQRLDIVGLKNGRLVFKDIEGIAKAYQTIQSFTKKDLTDLETELGFTSIYSIAETAREEYDLIQSEDQTSAWQEKYRQNPVLEIGDGYVEIKVGNTFGKLLPIDRCVYYGSALAKFTDFGTIIVFDGDENKLVATERTGIANEEDGVYIIGKPQDGGRTNCPLSNGWEDKDSDNNKRLRYNYSVNALIGPLTNGTFSHLVFFDYVGESRKKSGFSWIRTWINVRVTAAIGIKLVGACNPNQITFFATPAIDDFHSNVADFDGGYLIVNAITTNACTSFNIDEILTLADRVESPNTNDLQCPGNTNGVGFFCN